jgi:ribosomal protein L28
MANICINCGKKAVAGQSQQHGRGVAGKRWKKRAQATKRTFKPNLHTVTLIENGRKMRVKLCAKCIKRRKTNASFASL